MGQLDLVQQRSSTALLNEIHKTWPNANVKVLRGTNRNDVSGGSIFELRDNMRTDRYGRRYEGAHSHHSFTEDLCRREAGGLFQFVSQISPNGGDNFEDLTLLDTSNRDQALLVIAVEDENEIVMYRRLFTGLHKK